MNTLNFEKRTIGEQKKKNERTYFDFIVSGQSLRTILNADNQGLISPFGWGNNDYELEIIKEFRGQKIPQIPSKRLMIYVCADCGDIGCGAITADLEINDDKVIWKNFGYEDNSSEIDFNSFKDIPPFEFKRADYFEKFKNIKR
jgi:hypothetical protein